jgi:hypothetical protein
MQSRARDIIARLAPPRPRPPLRRGLLIALIAAVVAGGCAAAVIAAEQAPRAGPAHRGTLRRATGESLLAVAARYLGVQKRQLRLELRSGNTLAQVAEGTPGRSASGLIDTLVSTFTAKLGAAVAAGRLAPQAQSRLLARLHARVTAAVERVHPRGGRGRPRLALAARYLGIPLVQLRSELRAGRTLAQIADATPGRSASGLIAALLARVRARIDAQLAAGEAAQGRRRMWLSQLERRLQALVNRRLPARAGQRSR